MNSTPSRCARLNLASKFETGHAYPEMELQFVAKVQYGRKRCRGSNCKFGGTNATQPILCFESIQRLWAEMVKHGRICVRRRVGNGIVCSL